MSDKSLSGLSNKSKRYLGLRFKNPLLLEAALTHPSYLCETPRKSLHNFDRLEFFGDAILNFIICRKLYQIYPDATEGLLSRLRSILVSRKLLSRIAKDLRLQHAVRLNKSLESQSLDSKSKILADTFEALIAGLFLDQGFKPTEKFILKHAKPYLSAKKLFRLDPNPKSTLQEISQKNWQKLPLYKHVPVKSGIKVIVSLGGSRQATAVGRTHRDGEEKAARILIRKIRQETPSSRRKRVSSGKKSLKT